MSKLFHGYYTDVTSEAIDPTNEWKRITTERVMAYRKKKKEEREKRKQYKIKMKQRSLK